MADGSHGEGDGSAVPAEGQPPGEAPRRVREPSLVDAIIPLVTLVVLIAGSLLLFGLDALDGPIQVALILCVLVAALIVLKNGHSWEEIEHATQGSLASISTAIFILLAVGALIGVWNLSGTIPTLVYYGIQILSPAWYYAASALICGAISMSIGSSWTTAGTIGVGLTGVAAAIGVSPAITAGAVVSGAYLGDKLSPLSETTVLTAQLVGVRVDDHIKRQAWTSVPAFVIAFVVLLVLGLVKGPQVHAPVPTDIWLIIGAVTFGVLLEHFGLISRLINPLIATAKSTGRLFVTVFAVAFGLNVVAGDQYIALVLPAKMFRAEFARRGLAPTNLSRLAADSGTVTSPLVPWNSCGAFMGAVLGVSAFRYLPFAVFCYASPLLSVLYGITGFKIEKTGPPAPGPAGTESHQPPTAASPAD